MQMISPIYQLVANKNAHLLVDGLYVGLDNSCFEEDMFHVYIDCDLKKLRDIIEDCEKISHLTGDIYIINTSPWKWSVVSFSKHSWEEYLEIMGSFIHREVSYEWMDWNKEFSVLRVGSKQGCVPQILYKVRGRLKECEECRDFYMRVLRYYQRDR